MTVRWYKCTNIILNPATVFLLKGDELKVCSLRETSLSLGTYRQRLLDLEEEWTQFIKSLFIFTSLFITFAKEVMFSLLSIGFICLLTRLHKKKKDRVSQNLVEGWDTIQWRTHVWPIQEFLTFSLIPQRTIHGFWWKYKVLWVRYLRDPNKNLHSVFAGDSSADGSHSLWAC